MSIFAYFFWIAFPYITLTIFVLGHIYRYNYDQFGWSAKSSEFLSKDNKLKWGSKLFHWGIIFVFFGHVAGILVPKVFYEIIGVTDDMYHFGALWIGGAAGLATVIGAFLLFLRRVSVKRIQRNGSKTDLFVLIMLGVVVLVGFTNTVGYSATGGEFDYRETIGPWFRGIFNFTALPELMVTAPIGFQVHVIAAFLLFAIWPFTRLVHVWSLPLEYLRRKYIVYRKVSPKKALQTNMRED
jgi:nitrate reductase gamma subunit